MTTPSLSSLDLLRKLGSGVRPDSAGASAPGSRVGAPAFADLLSLAQSGGIESGRELQYAEGVAPSLSDDDLSRLARAADSAEAEGSTRLLALVGQKAVTIDVTTRTILGVRDAGASEGRVHTGVDSVVALGSAEGAEDAQPASILRSTPLHAGLLRILGAGGGAAG